MQKEVDTRFTVKVLAKTPRPQWLVWLAAHQDYSEDFVHDGIINDEGFPILECDAGQRIIKHLLSGGRGHFGPFEHPQITFACGFFPHDTIMQARTHRVGVSFDVQSQRYTGKRVLDYLRGTRTHDEVWYNTSRSGAEAGSQEYLIRLEAGEEEEDARRELPQGIRQHFVVSFNARSLMHFLDLRVKSDAQYEIQVLCNMFNVHFREWMPEVADWYRDKRWSKAKLSP